MKWALRALALLLALLLLAVGALLFALPRLAESEAARARIQEATRSVLGSELRYGKLDFGLLPPSLVVRDPALVGDDPGAPPLARADRVALRVQLLPLLRRQLEAQSLVVEGLALHLVRDEEGFALPRPASAGEASGGDAAPSAGSPADAGGSAEGTGAPPEASGIVLGIRSIALRDAALTIEDRSASPPVTSSLEEIDVDLRSDGAGAERRIAGKVRIARSDLTLSGLRLRGPLTAQLDGEDLTVLRGDFEVDADAAEIGYGADFAKPAGTRARVRGTLVRDARGALGVDDLVVELRDLVATGSLRTGEQTALRLEAGPVALAGWQELVPPLALVSPRGRLAVPELVLTPDLADARGRFALEDVTLQLPDSGPLSLSGEATLAGTTLSARDLRLLAADQPFLASPKLEGLGGTPRYEVRFETAGADSNALLAAFADLPDRLHGPLVAQGTLSGPLGGGKPLLETLSGRLELAIEGGRIVGASLLEAALGSLGARIAETTRQRGAEQWERFYTETFEQLSAKLRIVEGRLVSEPVTLRYPDYGVRLEGAIRLADMSLDLSGALSIGPAVDAELARAFGAPDDYTPSARELVIESVRGTPADPKVQLAGSSVANLTAHYLKHTQREDLRRAVEKELGPGSGEVVDRGLDLLEGLLGGGSKEP